MKPDRSDHELLLRSLDGRLTTGERRRAAELLRGDAAARVFLREVAEQAVMVADIERIAADRGEALGSIPGSVASRERMVVPADFRSRTWRMAAAAVFALLAAAVVLWSPAAQKTDFVRVSKITGSCQYFGSNGKLENAIAAGASLGAGDTLETRSCDAWIELKFHDGSAITIAGHSILEILAAEAGKKRFKLSQGYLWANPPPGSAGDSLIIQTPTLTAESRGAQFDIQSSTTETMLRVNDGSARVAQSIDGRFLEVRQGRQIAASLGKTGSFAAIEQPKPVNHWACDLGQAPEVILGKWLPPNGNERARLGADPLLWPIRGREPLMLYAVAMSAWKTSERPVLLRADSRLRFRGRTGRAQFVRFGFSAQKMRGVFAGKFEVDVQPSGLGPGGQTWEVELPLRNFKPLYPQLAPSPEGLEFTDVYALTVKEDAGLEISHIELSPVKERRE
jgi:hypothetical protein